MVDKTKTKAKTKKEHPMSRIREMVKDETKKTLSRALEKKTAQLNLSGFRFLNASNNTVDFENSNIFCIGPYGGAGVGPVIPQGVGQGERIGNSIKIKRAIVKGVLYPELGDQRACLLDVNIYILRVRTANNLNDAYQVIINSMFQDGDTDVPLTGVLTDNVLPINKDRIILYKHLVRKVGYAVNDEVTGPGSLVTALPNNDYKVNNSFSIDCTKYVTKNQRFNDANNFPTNELTWVVFSPVPATNQLNGVNENTVNCSFSISVEYTDA